MGLNLTSERKVAKMNFLAVLRDSYFGILKGGFSCVTPAILWGVSKSGFTRNDMEIIERVI
jgi:hypothetical protein